MILGGAVGVAAVTFLLYFLSTFETGAGNLRLMVTFGKILVGMIQIITQLGFTLDVT